MKREYVYLFIAVGLITAGLIGLGGLRRDFEVVMPREGLSPGTRLIPVELRVSRKAIEEQSVSFELEPAIPIVEVRWVGDKSLLLLTGMPLQAGETYTLRASEGSPLRGRVRIPVQPLRMRISEQPYWGPQGEPALLLSASAPVSEEQLSHIALHTPAGSPISFTWAALSAREGLLLLHQRQPIQVHSHRTEEYEIAGGRVEIPETPLLEVRETAVEEENGRLRVRLRFSQWLEGGTEPLSPYIRIGKDEPFTIELRGIDLYLYPAHRLTEPFAVEVRAGFPSRHSRLQETTSFILSPPTYTALRWAQPYVHFLTPQTPLLFEPDGSEEVDIEVWHIFPQNARLFFHQKAQALWINYPANPSKEWGDSWGWISEEDLRMYGEKIREGRVPVALLPAVSVRGRTYRRIGSELPPGIYYLSIRGKQWEALRTWVVVSEYALLSRRWKGGICVWAFHQKQNRPLGGVAIEVWGPAGQRLAHGETDRNGRLCLSLPPEIEPEGVWAVWSKQPSYIPLNGLRPGRWGFETQGWDPTYAPLLTYIQSGRTLFHPGEEVVAVGVVRERDLHYPQREIRIQAQLISPRNDILWEGELPMDNYGTWRWRYQLSPSAPTGEYQLLCKASHPKYSDPILAGVFVFQVDAFRPERLSLHVEPSVQNGKLSLSIQSEFLYGAVASGLAGETEIFWQPYSPSGPLAEGYVWEVSISDSAQSAFRRQQSFLLNEEGKALLSFPLPIGWGLGKVGIRTHILDDEGKPVRRLTHVEAPTQRFLLGMKKLPAYVEAGNPLSISLRALAIPTLTPAAETFSASAEVIERQYKYLLIETPWGGYRYEYRPTEKLIYRGKVEVRNGEGVLTFTPRGGEYEIRLWAPGQVFPTVQKVEAWGWGGDISLRGDPEGWVEILPQEPSYVAGKKARLLLKLPLDGQVLISVERDKVLHSEWIVSENQTAEVILTLSSDYVPGVYIHATAIHRAQGQVPFRVSRGLYYLRVNQPNSKLSPELIAPERVVPKGTVKVVVRGLPPEAQVLLAGVDGGLLPLQRQEAGNPHDFFYQKRAHGVSVSEQLPYSAPWGATVGGGESLMGMSEESAALAEVYDKPTAFFWGPLRASKSGEVSIEVHLPAFTGRLRWRAYVFTERAFGMGEAYTTVAAPVVARVGLPDFLAEGDKLLVPLHLQNTTEEVQTGRWTITGQGTTIEITPASGTFQLPPNAQQTLLLHLSSRVSLGRVKLTLKAGDYTLQEKEVRVRPPHAPRRKVFAQEIAPQSSITIRIPGEEYLPTTRRVRLVVASLPLEGLAASVWHLVHFPHGCGEQITSQAFAALVAGEWLHAIAGFSVDSLRAYIEGALAQLEPLVAQEGGISYWPGSPPDPWLSVYVAHFFYEAQRRGYSKALPLWKKVLPYQERLLATEAPHSRTQAYRALLLTRAKGSQIRSLLPSIKEVENISDPIIRSLWRGAFAQAGLHIPSPPAEKATFERQQEGELISPVRESALFLYAESFIPEKDRVPDWESRLFQQLHKLTSAWTTQETAWILLALSQHGEKIAQSGELVLDGSTRTFSALPWGETLTSHTGKMLTLRNKSSQPLYIALIAEGHPLAPQPAIESGLRIETAFRRKSDKMPVKAFSKGERFLWQITITSLQGTTRIPNIALTLPLPAGWHVENPRFLHRSEEFIADGGEIVYVDQRDDRLIIYFTMQKPSVQLTIPALVLYEGRYHLPSISVEAMYEPILFAASALTVIQIGRLP